MKFREEKGPILRVKFPHLVAGFPLSSGVVVGDSEDLALSLGTSFEAGPCLRVSCRPNSVGSPLSLVFKTGIGPWGSPNAAALAITAELALLGKGGPLFSMHLKPRLGDFSLRKRAKSVSHSRTTSLSEARNGDIQCQDVGLNARTPLKLENTALFTPMPTKCAFNKGHASLHASNGSTETVAVERLENGNDVDKYFGPNNSLKIEGLDQGVRGKGGMKTNSDGFREHESDSESPTATSGAGGPDDAVHEIGRKRRESLPVPRRVGIDGIFRGWSVIAHSTMPLGKHLELNAQWGLKVPYDTVLGLESSMSSFRLPYLSMQKISIATVNTLAQAPTLSSGLVHSEQLQPLATPEEIRELSQVAALCGSMKRHLHLLYAENKVLKTAMEQMKSEFEYRGSDKTGPAGAVNDALTGGKILPGPKLLDDPQRSIGHGNNVGETKERKHQRVDTGKHQDENNDGSTKTLHGTVASNGKSLSSTNKSLLD